MRLILAEMNSIVAGEHPQMRERGQVVNPVVTQHARIGNIEPRIVAIKL